MYMDGVVIKERSTVVMGTGSTLLLEGERCKLLVYLCADGAVLTGKFTWNCDLIDFVKER